MIKVVAFDVGGTLVYYKNPLNWSSLYEPALIFAMKAIGEPLTGEMISSAISVLTKYNTRVNHRLVEVKAKAIFDEILALWNNENIDSYNLRSEFFTFFQANAMPFPDALNTLKELKRLGMGVCALTDVAYGMDNEFALKDLCSLSDLIDVTFTSVDVGYRKPHTAGFCALLKYYGVKPYEMIYVGNEEKDVVGANDAGLVSVLFDNSSQPVNFSQAYTISALSEIIDIVIEINSVRLQNPAVVD